jgi:PAS domain S-box-containing protein
MPDDPIARILVVDDNPATLYSTARILRSANFSVIEATTGQGALDLAPKGVDLVMLDVNLPDIHGFEVCKRLRDDPRTARLPIIHVSATYVREMDKAQGLDAGSDGYITHPVEPQVLIATAKAFLRARQAEESLRESDARFKAVFENALGGILMLGHELAIVEVNPAMCRLLDRPREAIVGRGLLSFVAAGTEEQAAEIMPALQQQGTWKGTLPLVRSDGRSVHLEWYISARAFPSVAIATDITERIAMEEERQELLISERAARAEAEKANRLKDEFLGNLSHELRTPLNSILLWSQILQRSPDDPKQLSRGLEAIVRNTTIQTQLISDLLDVSRITSGKLRLEIEPTDPAVVVKTALEISSPAAAAKGLKVELALDPATGLVSGDPSRLQQVVWNLLNNAVKFTPKGGRIQVSLERVESNIEISVADNGQGIKPELLPFLFERFRQGDAGKNRMHGGLGLGLAIVKHLTELHGGTVFAVSEGEGRGAKFTVRLPIVATYEIGIGRNSVPSARFSDEHRDQLESVRVLIVDDDPDTCAVMSQILSAAGAAVASACSADEALNKLDVFVPNVLVSDIGMPGRDGYDLIREVRARGFSAERLPAIALTALARPEDRRRALLAGFQLHVPKPNDATELTTAIQSLIRLTPQTSQDSELRSPQEKSGNNGQGPTAIRGDDSAFGRIQRAIRGLTSGIRR